MGSRRLGRRFGWFWAAYTVSAAGTGFGFGAFSLIAILVLHAGPAGVSVLAAAGLAAGAVAAVPLGPWVEFRRKRPVMIAMDLTRCAALASVPAAFALGRLTFAQLLIVSMIAAAARIAFRSASGAYLKTLVGPGDLVAANGWLESTTWTATVLGPPLGGAAIGLFGPVTTMAADAVSYLLSAAATGAIGGREPRPPRAAVPRVRAGDLLDGWRHILSHRVLRLLFFNTLAVNGLIMATEPPVVVLMLGRLHFAPWQYCLSFALPCAGGLIGSRLAGRLAARFGEHKVMLTAGALRACWLPGLAFIRPGAAGIVIVMLTQFGLVTCVGVFNPVFAACRLRQTPAHRVARTLSAWWITSYLTIAALTLAWGLLASITSPRAAIAAGGLLILPSVLLLPRREHTPQTAPEPARIRNAA